MGCRAPIAEGSMGSRARACNLDEVTVSLAKVESRMDLLTWMVGFNLAMTGTIAVKIFLR
jgi:hypothetical protein